jgi:hypothetical protein
MGETLTKSQSQSRRRKRQRDRLKMEVAAQQRALGKALVALSKLDAPPASCRAPSSPTRCWRRATPAPRRCGQSPR